MLQSYDTYLLLESFIDKAGSLGNLSALLSNIFGVNIIFNLIYMLS